jgi:hypothetical protein
MATTTIDNKRAMGTKNFYAENRTLYWVIGALVLAALIIFFSMGRDTAQNSVMPANPATVEQSAAPGTAAPKTE